MTTNYVWLRVTLIFVAPVCSVADAIERKQEALAQSQPALRADWEQQLRVLKERRTLAWQGLIDQAVKVVKDGEAPDLPTAFRKITCEWLADQGGFVLEVKQESARQFARDMRYDAPDKYVEMLRGLVEQRSLQHGLSELERQLEQTEKSAEELAKKHGAELFIANAREEAKRIHDGIKRIRGQLAHPPASGAEKLKTDLRTLQQREHHLRVRTERRITIYPDLLRPCRQLTGRLLSASPGDGWSLLANLDRLRTGKLGRVLVEGVSRNASYRAACESVTLRIGCTFDPLDVNDESSWLRWSVLNTAGSQPRWVVSLIGKTPPKIIEEAIDAGGELAATGVDGVKILDCSRPSTECRLLARSDALIVGSDRDAVLVRLSPDGQGEPLADVAPGTIVWLQGSPARRLPSLLPAEFGSRSTRAKEFRAELRVEPDCRGSLRVRMATETEAREFARALAAWLEAARGSSTAPSTDLLSGLDVACVAEGSLVSIDATIACAKLGGDEEGISSGRLDAILTYLACALGQWDGGGKLWPDTSPIPIPYKKDFEAALQQHSYARALKILRNRVVPASREVARFDWSSFQKYLKTICAQYPQLREAGPLQLEELSNEVDKRAQDQAAWQEEWQRIEALGDDTVVRVVEQKIDRLRSWENDHLGSYCLSAARQRRAELEAILALLRAREDQGD